MSQSQSSFSESINKKRFTEQQGGASTRSNEDRKGSKQLLPIEEAGIKRPTRSAKPFKIKKTRYHSAGKQRPHGDSHEIEDFLDDKLKENFNTEVKPKIHRVKRPSSTTVPKEHVHQAFMSSIPDRKQKL